MSDETNDGAEIRHTRAQSHIQNDIDTSIDFHRHLVASILDVGVRHASPLKIVEQMTDQASCHHLTMEQVKSHLQRYRKGYKEHEKQKFLNEYDKFTDIVDRVYNHAQHPGSFAMVDLNYVVGGRAAAMVSHQVRAEYSDPVTAQRFNVLDQFSFVHSEVKNENSARKHEQERRPFYHRHQMKHDERTEEAETETNQTVRNNQNPTQSKQVRDAMLIRAPILTEKEKATPLGAAIQQIVGLIQNYAEYINNDEGHRPPTVPEISDIQQDPNQQQQLRPHSKVPTSVSQIKSQPQPQHQVHQHRQREEGDQGQRQKQEQQDQSFPRNSDDGHLPLNTHHLFESIIYMDGVNNNNFLAATTKEEEEEEDPEIGDPVLGRFHPIGDGDSGSDGGNAVGSASSSRDCDIEDNKDGLDPLRL